MSNDSTNKVQFRKGSSRKMVNETVTPPANVATENQTESTAHNDTLLSEQFEELSKEELLKLAIKESVDKLPESVTKSPGFDVILKLLTEAKTAQLEAELSWKQSQQELEATKTSSGLNTKVLSRQEIQTLLLGSLASNDRESTKEEVLEQGKKILFAYIWLVEDQFDEGGEPRLTMKQQKSAEDFFNGLGGLSSEDFEKNFWIAIKKCFSLVKTKAYSKKSHKKAKENDELITIDNDDDNDETDSDTSDDTEDSEDSESKARSEQQPRKGPLPGGLF